MKKIILHLDSGNGSLADAEEAGQILGSLSGVLVTDIQGDHLIVHCGQRLDDTTLIHKLHEKGCSASVVSDLSHGF